MVGGLVVLTMNPAMPPAGRRPASTTAGEQGASPVPANTLLTRRRYRVTIGLDWCMAGEVVSVAVTIPAGDARVVAVRAALEPFAWQSFTAELVCRRAVAAMDGGQVLPRPRGPLSRPSPQEECAAALVEILSTHRWRSLTVDGLSRLLVGAAQACRQERAWFDIRLGLLLDGIG